ncbi:hypothetical protein [Arthrobacter sp. SLBN-100]|nr:hypothetical protein [Arthrobacter sp. SLBN-100]
MSANQDLITSFEDGEQICAASNSITTSRSGILAAKVDSELSPVALA